jgi:hypothetical protein
MRRAVAARKKVKDLQARSTWVQEVRDFRVSFDQKDNDWVSTNALRRKIADHVAKKPGTGLTLGLFNEIVKWKLDRQEGRTRHRRGTKVTKDLLRQITICAFGLRHTDRDSLTRARLMVLQGIPGVGMGIASAILALTFPDEYGVIDDIVWKVIYGSKKESFWIADYRKYLEDLLSASSTLGWPPQEVDFFAWKMGRG